MPEKKVHPKAGRKVVAGKSARVPGTADLVDPEGIQCAANRHIVGHYPFGCLGGTPRLLTLGSRELWIVPIVLTSPGYGAVGEVGFVALDAPSCRVVGSTPRAEVGPAISRLRKEKHDELDAAFRCTRKT